MIFRGLGLIEIDVLHRGDLDLTDALQIKRDGEAFGDRPPPCEDTVAAENG